MSLLRAPVAAETLSVPLSKDSNAAACLNLLTALTMGKATDDALPALLMVKAFCTKVLAALIVSSVKETLNA